VMVCEKSDWGEEGHSHPSKPKKCWTAAATGDWKVDYERALREKKAPGKTSYQKSEMQDTEDFVQEVNTALAEGISMGGERVIPGEI